MVQIRPADIFVQYKEVISRPPSTIREVESLFNKCQSIQNKRAEKRTLFLVRAYFYKLIIKSALSHSKNIQEPKQDGREGQRNEYLTRTNEAGIYLLVTKVDGVREIEER